MDVQDLVMQNIEYPLVLDEAKGLVYYLRTIERLPESLDAIVKDFNPAAH